MSNTSATGGYLKPDPQFPELPSGLTFHEFIQTVFVGVSGLTPELVRPKWQLNPPKQPDVLTNWLAIGLVNNIADANAFVGFVPDGLGGQVNVTQRMEALEIQAAFYGPLAMEYAALTRDSFQIDQNRIALTNAGMGFTGTGDMMRVPDLVNERWVDRYEMSFFFNRQLLRHYPILYLLSVSGNLKADVHGTIKTIDWKVITEET